MAMLLRLKELQGKGDGGWKKKCLHHLSVNQKIARVENMCSGHPIA